MKKDEFNIKTATAVYLCGPKPFMAAVKQCGLELGFAEESIHYESFGPTTAI